MKSILGYKKPAICLFAIWTIVGLCFSGVELIASSTENRPIKLGSILAANLIRAYVWGVLSPLVFIFAKRFRIDPRRLRARAVVYNLMFGFALAGIYPWLFIAFERLTDAGALGAIPSWRVLFTRQLIFAWYTIISLYLPTFLAVQALLFFRGYRDEEAKNAALQAEVSQAQLSALKMQLHPHFLFNSLHAISSLILVDPARANKMVALLGDFLRQTLDRSQEQMVTLETELGFLRCYLEIEETRFEDRLSVEYDIDPEMLGVPVPHLILQPIVENAVKHGIAPFAARGNINIGAKRQGPRLLLRVKDSGTGDCPAVEDVGGPKNGVGIANVRKRLLFIYGDQATLTITNAPGAGCQVDITLPLGPDADDGRGDQ